MGEGKVHAPIEVTKPAAVGSGQAVEGLVGLTAMEVVVDKGGWGPGRDREGGAKGISLRLLNTVASESDDCSRRQSRFACSYF